VDRVRSAVERHGKPIDDDRLDVEVALLSCHWYDTAVCWTEHFGPLEGVSRSNMCVRR